MTKVEYRMEERSSHTGQAFLYFGSLTLFVYLASPSAYLLDFQTSYMLKNQLHATAEQTSAFRLVTAMPVYFAFAFGFFRDAWNPFGLRDRGYLLIFSTATALVFTVMAFLNLSYGKLYAGMFLAMIFFRFAMAAYQGLMALVGQEKLMSGRLSVLWQVVQTAPLVAGGWASGYISMYSNRISLSYSRLTSPVLLACSVCGSRDRYSAMPTTNRRPRARVWLVTSSDW